MKQLQNEGECVKLLLVLFEISNTHMHMANAVVETTVVVQVVVPLVAGYQEFVRAASNTEHGCGHSSRARTLEPHDTRELFCVLLGTECHSAIAKAFAFLASLGCCDDAHRYSK